MNKSLVGIPPELEDILGDNKIVTTEVRIGDYITDNFLQEYTNFKNYEEFIDFSPYSEEELALDSSLFHTNKMNRYIELTTQFPSFDEMVSFAVEKKLFDYVEEVTNRQ